MKTFVADFVADFSNKKANSATRAHLVVADVADVAEFHKEDTYMARACEVGASDSNASAYTPINSCRKGLLSQIFSNIATSVTAP